MCSGCGYQTIKQVSGSMLGAGHNLDMGATDPQEVIGKVIECSFDQETKTWIYMRERKDKDMPNAFHVFEKVLRSIQDNITQDNLIDYIKAATQKPVYEKDKDR